MLKTKKVFICGIIVLLLVFCFGCNKFSSGIGQTDKPLSPWDMDFHKGTKGLTMKLVENQPPSEVWENSVFQIAVELRNEGAANIKESLLYISDFKYVSVNKIRSVGDLTGKSATDPVGRLKIESFEVNALEVKDDDKADSFVVTACYKYETKAGIEICINPNVMDIAKLKEGDCNPSSVSASGGQGAPVAVTKVEEDFIPINDGGILKTKVLFKIHIANLGSGKLVKTDAFGKECIDGSSLDAEKESNVVHVKDVSFSKYSLVSADKNYKIDCTGFKNDTQSDLKIGVKGDAILSCSTVLDGNNAFTTPLLVELEYGYTDYITKSITIKNIPGT